MDWNKLGRRVRHALVSNWREWAVLIVQMAVLLPSLSHVAWSFMQLENATLGGRVVGWMAAVGVDAGIVLLMWLAAERRRRADDGRWWHGTQALFLPVLGVVIAAVVSAFANLDHGLAAQVGRLPVAGDLWTLDSWTLGRVVILSATLPTLTMVLAALTERASASRVVIVPKALRTASTSLAVTGAARSPRSVLSGEKRELVIATAAADPSLSQSEVARMTGVSRTTTSRWLRQVGLG